MAFKYFISISLLFLSLSIYAQECSESTLETYEIRAKDTDSNISWELNKHFAYFNTDCSSKNTLLVFFVGSFDNPKSLKLFPKLAANNGFHVVVLKYPNNVAAQQACISSSDASCYYNFRKEIIQGTDLSTEVTVDSINCINNRLLKLLQYLDTEHSNQNWNQYFSGNNVSWNKIIVAGHSQGGGHAALIAKENKVKRCIMFASPNDYSTNFNTPANWVSSSSQTADSLYYGFLSLYDDVVDFDWQFQSFNLLGMSTFGDTLLIDDLSLVNSKTRQLYTKQTITGAGGNHSIVIRDNKTPIDVDGKPVFTNVWEYLLGIQSKTISYVSTIDKKYVFEIFPNPTKENLFINTDCKKCFVEVDNVLGQSVFTRRTLLNNSSIDLSSLKKGLYYIVLSDGNQTVEFKKIILK